MQLSGLFKMTVNISKRKEALINIIMLPREMSPNTSRPQAPIMPSYGLRVEPPCTHPTFRLNSRVLSSWEAFMAEGSRTNKNVISQSLYHVPVIQKVGGSSTPTTPHLCLPPGCALQMTLKWIHFCSKSGLLGFCNKTATPLQAAGRCVGYDQK